MSDVMIREFYKKMEKNEDFFKKLFQAQNNNEEIKDQKEKLEKIIEEAVIPFAKKNGYNFTVDELIKYEEGKEPNLKKLEAADVNLVSGGVGRHTAGTLLALLTMVSGIGTAGAAFADPGKSQVQAVSSVQEQDPIQITSIKDRMKSMKGTLEKVIRPGVSPEDVFKERVAAKRAEKSKSHGTSVPTTAAASSFVGVKLLGTVRNAMTGNIQPAFTLVNWYSTYVSQFNLMVMQSDNDQAALAYNYAQEVALVLKDSTPNSRQEKLIKAEHELFKTIYEKWKENLDGKLPEGCETEPIDPFNPVIIKTTAASVGVTEQSRVPTPPPAPPMLPVSPSISPGPSDRAGLLAGIQKGVKLKKTSPSPGVQQATTREEKQEPTTAKQVITPQKKTPGDEAKTLKAEEIRKTGFITTYDKTLKNGETTTLVYNSQSHVLDGDISELTSSDLDKLGVGYYFECRNEVSVGQDLASKGWEKVTRFSGIFKSNYRYIKVMTEQTSTPGVALKRANDGNVYVEDNRPIKSSPVKLTKGDLEKARKWGANAVWGIDKFELSDDVQNSWEQKDGWVYYGYHVK